MTVAQPYLANALMNHIFRASAYSMPTTLGLALFTGTVECTGGAYARVNVIGSSNWTAPVNGAILNVNAIDFAAATSPWGIIDHYGLFDALTGGDLLIYDALQLSRQVNQGDIFNFPANQLELAIG
jgi:hypothetical protein